MAVYPIDEFEVAFGLVRGQSDIDFLRSMTSVDMEILSASGGRINLPYGGRLRWRENPDSINIYISHDLAQVWVVGATVVTLLCTVLTFVPLGQIPGIVCATVWGFSAAAVNYWDGYGDPGFDIKATPSRVWIVP